MGTQVEESETKVQGQQSWVRIGKARLTAGGFKDVQAYTKNLKTYSGTARKWQQRAVNAFAAQNNY
eukprot:8602373-Prorocentrum_lima.AAC.1